jgi:hypothetical protein
VALHVVVVAEAEATTSVIEAGEILAELIIVEATTISVVVVLTEVAEVVLGKSVRHINSLKID